MLIVVTIITSSSKSTLVITVLTGNVCDVLLHALSMRGKVMQPRRMVYRHSVFRACKFMHITLFRLLWMGIYTKPWDQNRGFAESSGDSSYLTLVCVWGIIFWHQLGQKAAVLLLEGPCCSLQLHNNSAAAICSHHKNLTLVIETRRLFERGRLSVYKLKHSICLLNQHRSEIL